MATLTGKTALVTGGSRGIGRAIAERLARDGALVAVHHGGNAEAAAETVAAIERAGGSAFPVGQRLGADGDAAALLDGLDRELLSRTGSTRLDVVVNNAGIAFNGGISDTTPELYDELFAVNVRSPFFIVQGAVERMGEGGRIVSISSGVAQRATPNLLAYAMTKAAVEIFTRTLAKELAPRGITVNAVAPGLIDTEGNAPWLDASEESRAQAAAVSAFNRVGQPADVADVVAFVVSDDARWVTGQVLDATGGSLL